MALAPLSEEDRLRRLRLRVMAKLLVAVGLLAMLWVLLAQVFSGGGQTTAMPGLRVDISDLAPGQSRIVNWQDRPVILYYRRDEEIAQLSQFDERLLDPVSRRSTQPDGLQNDWRSLTPTLFVAIALGTDLGCSIDLLPAGAADFQGRPWDGGFRDGCRGARYDLAGRVYRSQYADRNLVVPSYHFDGQTLVLGQ